MAFFEPNNFFDLKEYEHKELFIGVKNIWLSLLNINIYFKSKRFKKLQKIPSGCFIENPEKVFIGENTIIEPNTFIKGPCIIGKNCQIRHGAYIRGNVITGDGCIIGHCTEMKNSILLNNVHAAHFAYIGDSLLGNNVNLGAGVRCANFRLDNKVMTFYFEGNKICTNLQKLGSIIGDDSQIGCNTVLNPATFLGKKTICYANLNIGGYFSSNSLIKQLGKTIVKKINARVLKNGLNAAVEK